MSVPAAWIGQQDSRRHATKPRAGAIRTEARIGWPFIPAPLGVP